MIIEIALGIVLAVLILWTLPYILALALIALGIAIVLAVVAAAIYFAFTAPEVFFTLLAILAVIFGWAHWKDTREAKRKEAEQIARAEAKPRDLADDEPQSEVKK